MAGPATATVQLQVESNVLSDRQLCRVACLKAARSALVTQSVLSQGAADPIDLVQLARYIETGEDPWSDAEKADDGMNAKYFHDGWEAALREVIATDKHRGPESAVQWAKDHGQRVQPGPVAPTGEGDD